MGEFVFGIYALVSGVGVLSVFYLLPKKRRKQIVKYIVNLDN